MTEKALAAVEALGAAIAARSKEQILAIYADDIVVWHGSTGAGMGREDNAGMLDGVFRLTSDLNYINIKRHFFDGGVVQQHRLVGTFVEGKELPGLEACLVIKVNEEGLITRIDEYFDGGVFSEVWERLATLEPS